MIPFGLSWGREDIFITGWGDSPVSHHGGGQAPLLEVCHVRSEVVLKCNFNIHQLIRKFRLMQTFFLTYRHPPSFLLQKKLHSCNRICCCLSLSVKRGRYWVNPGSQQRREVRPAFLLQALASGAAILISAPWRSADKAEGTSVGLFSGDNPRGISWTS